MRGRAKEVAVVRTIRSLLLLSALIPLGCGTAEETPTGATSITIEEITIGTGAVAVVGDTVTVHYVGTFLNGTVFDSSVARGTPLDPFRLGSGAVIPGFDQGVQGMRVGGQRRVTVPPSLAYGSQGSGPVPPNTTIRFDIQLLAIAGK
jgi:FKBP-type peptidyl-prolyl cis-trans isomerase FkpA